jgi:hypothetical protein
MILEQTNQVNKCTIIFFPFCFFFVALLGLLHSNHSSLDGFSSNIRGRTFQKRKAAWETKQTKVPSFVVFKLNLKIPQKKLNLKKQCSSNVANKIHTYISCCKETNYPNIKNMKKIWARSCESKLFMWHGRKSAKAEGNSFYPWRINKVN